MPFVLVSQVPCEQQKLLPHIWDMTGGNALALITDWPWLRHLGKPMAIALAIFAELVLLWAVLSFLNVSPAQTGMKPMETVFTLSTVEDKDKAALDKTADQSAGKETKKTATSKAQQATIADDLIAPVEWSISAIAVRPSQDIKDGQGQDATGAAASSGRASGGGYDPYAGTAMLPLNRQKAIGAVSGIRVNWPSSSDDAAWTTANRRALIAWLQELKQHLPNARGSVQLTLSINEDGQIMAAKVMQGDALPQVQQFITQHAKTRLRLSIGTKNTLVMPELHMVG